MLYYYQIHKFTGVFFVKLSEIRKLTQNIPVPLNAADQRKRNEYLADLGYDPGKLYQELEMESRYVDTHQDTSFNNTNVNLHSHSFYELLYCRNTCGAEYLVGSDRYRLQKGDIILIAPGVSHRPLLPEHMTEPYKRDVLWISVEFIQTLYRVIPDAPGIGSRTSSLLRTAGTQWEFLGDLFRNGVRETEKQAPGWELAVMGNTLTLLTNLYRAYLDRAAAPLKAEKPELLDQVMSYVEQHLGEKITLADVSRHFFISESTITQTFRNKMGVSFYRCVTQRRLIAAKALIEGGMMLESVGEHVGFTDYSAFYRAFKQEYGISPRQYRKLQETSDRVPL